MKKILNLTSLVASGIVSLFFVVFSLYYIFDIPNNKARFLNYDLTNLFMLDYVYVCLGIIIALAVALLVLTILAVKVLYSKNISEKLKKAILIAYSVVSICLAFAILALAILSIVYDTAWTVFLTVLCFLFAIVSAVVGVYHLLSVKL